MCMSAHVALYSVLCWFFFFYLFCPNWKRDLPQHWGTNKSDSITFLMNGRREAWGRGVHSRIHTLLKPTPQFLQNPALERKVALMNIAIIKKTKELFLKLLVLLCSITRLKVKRTNVKVLFKNKIMVTIQHTEMVSRISFLVDRSSVIHPALVFPPPSLLSFFLCLCVSHPDTCV